MAETPTRATTGSGHRSTKPAGSASGSGRAAARTVHEKQSTRIPVPLLGQVELPPRNHLAFLGGVGVLALAGVVEWPVALLLGVGHALTSQSHNRSLDELGEALDEA